MNLVKYLWNIRNQSKVLGSQYETESLDVKEVCFDKEQSNQEKSRKSTNITEWCRHGKCVVMEINVECLRCNRVEVLRHFQFSGTRCDDAKAVTQKGYIYSEIIHFK